MSVVFFCIHRFPIIKKLTAFNPTNYTKVRYRKNLSTIVAFYKNLKITEFLPFYLYLFSSYLEYFRDISVLICFYLNAFELGRKIDCCLDVLLGFDTIKQKYSLNKMKTDINKKVRILLFLNFYKMQQLLTNFYAYLENIFVLLYQILIRHLNNNLFFFPIRKHLSRNRLKRKYL
jgi:hypothetical protein